MYNNFSQIGLASRQLVVSKLLYLLQGKSPKLTENLARNGTMMSLYTGKTRAFMFYLSYLPFIPLTLSVGALGKFFNLVYIFSVSPGEMMFSLLFPTLNKYDIFGVTKLLPEGTANDYLVNAESVWLFGNLVLFCGGGTWFVCLLGGVVFVLFCWGFLLIVVQLWGERYWRTNRNH